jgi:hypothetical protein
MREIERAPLRFLKDPVGQVRAQKTPIGWSKGCVKLRGKQHAEVEHIPRLNQSSLGEREDLLPHGGIATIVTERWKRGTWRYVFFGHAFWRVCDARPFWWGLASI